MKPLLIFSLFALFFSGSCKKEEPELQLPPYTQEGKNIVACKINGNIFITEGKKIPNSWSERGINYGCTQDSNIYISASEADPFDADLSLRFNYSSLSAATLKSEERNSAYLRMPISNKQLAETSFYTTSENTGAVEVKYFQDNIIAGTFQFDASDGEGNIVHVTDGRFDISTK